MSIKNKEEMAIIAKNKLNLLTDINKINHILNDNDKEELNRKIEKLKDWNDRLLDNRYRVAIIGTEKAGKSTFANALLRRDFLPEDEGRCTFTTTTIESSKKEDQAEIEFFTKQEFMNKFNELCDEIKFNCNYNTVTISELDDFSNDTSSAIATSNAVDDIRDIIQKKEQIEQYLSGNIQIFIGQDVDNIKSYITDEVKARAVKNITIKSTQFKEQENLIIYDVPGFDSPTKLHLEQAKWYMRNADIVIMLVSIADRISFVKAQADFLNDTKDRYGQKLSNKLIVVASKFDKHIVDDKKSSDTKIEKSYKILSDELSKYGLYKESNIFKASSLGFLEKENIVNTKYAYPNLEKHNYSDGLKNIEIRLEAFLNGEALEILNENFNIDNSDIETFLLKFKKDFNPKQDEKKKRSEEFNLIDEKWEKIQKSIKDEMKWYKEDLSFKTFDLDESIKKQVETNWIDELKGEIGILVSDAQSDILAGRANIEQATKINDYVREKIYNISLKNIVDISTEAIDEKNEIENKFLFGKIKEILLNNIDSKEINDELSNVLYLIIKDFKYDSKSYKPLILRFLNDIFETLLLNKITNVKDDSRIQRFERSRPNIEGLLYITGEYDDIKTTFEQDIIQQILIQNSNVRLRGNNDFEELLTHVKVAITKEEVIQEIETDLENLKEIFNNIVLKAIKIESPFKDSLNDQVQAILNDISENSKSKLRKLFILNIESIAREEYQSLTIDKDLSEKLINIILNIDELNN